MKEEGQSKDEFELYCYTEGDMKIVKLKIDRKRYLKWTLTKGMNKGWELLRGEESGRKYVAWVPLKGDLVHCRRRKGLEGVDFNQ